MSETAFAVCRPETPFAGKLLVSDMDGTLLDGGSRLSPANLDAIYAFIDGGGRFAVATGREAGSVRRLLGPAPVNTACIIFGGAMLYDMGAERPLWERPLEPETLEVLRAAAKGFPGLGIELFLDRGAMMLAENDTTRWHSARDGFSVRSVPQDSVRCYKAIVAWEPEKLAPVKRFLDEAGLNTVYSEPWFIDVAPRGASKGECLRRLAERLGIGREDVCAVGDYYNDIDMLRWAGRSFAVANACDAAKLAADEICAGNDEAALWDVVTRLARQ